MTIRGTSSGFLVETRKSKTSAASPSGFVLEGPLPSLKASLSKTLGNLTATSTAIKQEPLPQIQGTLSKTLGALTVKPISSDTIVYTNAGPINVNIPLMNLGGNNQFYEQTYIDYYYGIDLCMDAAGLNGTRYLISGQNWSLSRIVNGTVTVYNQYNFISHGGAAPTNGQTFRVEFVQPNVVKFYINGALRDTINVTAGDPIATGNYARLVKDEPGMYAPGAMYNAKFGLHGGPTYHATLGAAAPKYRGIRARSAIYKGTLTDAQLFKGTGILF